VENASPKSQSEIKARRDGMAKVAATRAVKEGKRQHPISDSPRSQTTSLSGDERNFKVPSSAKRLNAETPTLAKHVDEHAKEILECRRCFPAGIAL
jgi:hypothetical protein